MINSVSFGTGASTGLSAIINKPQKYRSPEASTSAATGINSGEKKKSNKTLLKVLVAAAAIAGGLAASKHFNIFAAKEGGNAILEGAKKYADQAGGAIIKYAKKGAGYVQQGFNFVKGKVQSLIHKAPEVAEEVADAVV